MARYYKRRACTVSKGLIFDENDEKPFTYTDEVIEDGEYVISVSFSQNSGTAEMHNLLNVFDKSKRTIRLSAVVTDGKLQTYFGEVGAMYDDAPILALSMDDLIHLAMPENFEGFCGLMIKFKTKEDFGYPYHNHDKEGN